jgi:hypothetical protein
VSFDPIIELTLNGSQIDITPDVTGRGDGFRIGRGQPNEAGKVTPSTCEFELNNQDGKYSPRNPLGPYYTTLVRNTPVRVCTRELAENFDRTVVNGWGNAPGGQAWQLDGIGGTVANSDWQVTPGKGTMSLPALGANRRATLTGIQYQDVDVSAVFHMETLLPTGGCLVEAGLTFRVADDINRYSLIAYASSNNGSYTLSLRREGFSPVVLATKAFHGFWFQDQYLFMRVQIEGSTIRAKAATTNAFYYLNDNFVEPASWTLTATDSEIVSGGVGLHIGLNSSPSIQLPTVIAANEFEVRSPRFSGDLASLPPRWDFTGRAAWVPVEAAGVLRRLSRNDVPIGSAPRRYHMLRVDQTTPFNYWSLEESADIGMGVEAYNRMGPARYTTGTAKWAQGALGGWLPNVASIGANDSLATDYGTFTVGTSAFSFQFVRQGGTGTYESVLYLDGALNVGTGMYFDGRNGTFGRITRGGADTQLFPGLDCPSPFDGFPHHYQIDVSISGTTVNWTYLVDGIYLGGFSQSSVTLLNVLGFVISGRPASVGTSAYGHVSVGLTSRLPTDRTIPYKALMGWLGERAGLRVKRLCDEGFDERSALDAVALDSVGDLNETAPMGPQSMGTFLGLLQECADADRGVVYEPRGSRGLAYRTNQSRYNQQPVLSLSYGSKELAPPWEPTEDDQLTVNDASVTRAGGGSFHYEQTDGPLSVTSIGRYRKDETQNVANDTQLPSMASWVCHLGTVDEARFPRIGVNRARPQIRNNAALSADVLKVDLGDRLAITDVTDISVYGALSQLVLGYEERVDQYQHTFVFNCAPESPYQVVGLNRAPEGLIESASSTLAIPLDAASTKLVIDVGGPEVLPGQRVGALWTTSGAATPFTISIDGEDMRVTAIADAGANFGMDFIGAGSPVSGVYSTPGSPLTLRPSPPAGVLPGDLLLTLAGCRDNGGLATLGVSGYKTLGRVDSTCRHVNLFGRFHQQGIAPAPSVDFGGTIAVGSDCSAQVAAFRGVNVHVLGEGMQTGTSQNILCGAAYFAGETRPYLAIYTAWKETAWTTATANWYPIGSFTATAGDDQSLAWEYMWTKYSSPQSVAFGATFTVTGGAASTPYVGRTVVLTPRVQSFTVERAINGVRKSHAAGSAVRLARSATLAL